VFRPMQILPLLQVMTNLKKMERQRFFQNVLYFCMCIFLLMAIVDHICASFTEKKNKEKRKSLLTCAIVKCITFLCFLIIVMSLLLEQGACRIVALPFTFKNMLMQKKNYGNSNISPGKNIIFKKSSKRNQNPSSYYNSIITNLKFQHKPKYHLSKILI